MEINRLANTLRMGWLETSRVLQRLGYLGFVAPAAGTVMDRMEGRQHVRLTPGGVEYCVQQGLLKTDTWLPSHLQRLILRASLACITKRATS